MNYLSKDDFLKQKLKTIDLDVKGLGKVKLQEMSGKNRGMYACYADDCIDGKHDFSNYKTKLVALCLLAPNGGFMFAANELEKLASIPFHMIEQLYEACSKLNKLDKYSEEQTVKN